MNLGLLVALENAHKVLSDIQRIFNTVPYGGPPLKIKILKIGLRHVLSWPKLGLEPKFHESGTFGGFGKRAQSLSRIFNTGPYGDPPLKIKISKIGLRHVLSWPKLGLEPKFHDRFSNFLFLRGSPYGPVFKINPFSVVHANISRLWT